MNDNQSSDQVDHTALLMKTRYKLISALEDNLDSNSENSTAREIWDLYMASSMEVEDIAEMHIDFAKKIFPDSNKWEETLSKLFADAIPAFCRNVVVNIIRKVGKGII